MRSRFPISVNALPVPGTNIPELPFTDLIRDPKGRDIVRNVLLGLNWQIRTDANAGFILGDVAVLHEKSDLGSGLRTPLSKTTALYLTPSKTPRQGIDNTVAKSFEVDDLNYESAARADANRRGPNAGHRSRPPFGLVRSLQHSDHHSCWRRANKLYRVSPSLSESSHGKMSAFECFWAGSRPSTNGPETECSQTG